MSEAERWNLSPERLYLDCWTRWFLRRHLRADRITRACNVGVGFGEWDDWLCLWLPRPGLLTSVDIDRAVLTRFSQRQSAERHPRPAKVVHGDLFDLEPESFDLVTAVGATLAESGNPERAVARLLGWVRPGGHLYLAIPHRGVDVEALLAGVPDPVARTTFDELPGAELTAVLVQAR